MSKPSCKKKVCCFCERWESGGIESFLYNVLTRIDLAQFQVDIVASELGKSIFTKPLQELGIQFFELSGNQHKIAENHHSFRALLRERHYDVLHLNAFHGMSLAYLQIAKQVGVPVRIAHSHNTALRKSLTRPLKLVAHGWAKERYTTNATELWACSRLAAKFLFSRRELDRKGFQFIPNGIDTVRFRFNPMVREAVRAELGLDKKFVVGNVGRLCYQKNQTFLLDVFADILKHKPNSCLLLVGEGQAKAKLKRRAQQLGIIDKILFYGLSDHVEHLLWAMDVFVLPSRFEGLPVTSIEAQYSGIKCVFSSVITSECTIADSNVSFMELSCPKKQWTEVICNSEESLNKRERMNIENKFFDIENVVQMIEKKILLGVDN